VLSVVNYSRSPADRVGVAPHLSTDSGTNNAKAKDRVQLFFRDSTLDAVREGLPTFDKAELMLGRALGKGGFSDVNEIRSFFSGIKPPKLRLTHSAAIDDDESREFIATHCTRPGGDARYAIKKLRRDVLNDPDRCWVGISDLAVET
jgi:hypothetical protein